GWTKRRSARPPRGPCGCWLWPCPCWREDWLSPGSADLVIRGPVYTAVPALRWAGAVAVAAGRIVAVGSAGEIDGLIGPGTRTLDVPGGMVAPGFQDSHIHPDGGGMALSQCRLDDVRGIDVYRDRIRAYAEAHPQAEWILGHGWSLDDFPGGTPHRSLLDDLVPDRPVYLPNRDGHGAWVNSRALALAGITRDTRPARRPDRAGPGRLAVRRPARRGHGSGGADRARAAPAGAPAGPAGRAGIPALAGRHRLAGRPRLSGDTRGIPLSRGARGAHRPGGRRAVVNAPSRHGTGAGIARAPRPGQDRPGPGDVREDHAGRDHRELHLGRDRAVPGRRREARRPARALLRLARPPQQRGHAPRPPRVPGPHPRHRGPGRPRGARRVSGGPNGERPVRPAPPHRPPPGGP